METVYVVINTFDGEVVGVCASQEVALHTITQYAIKHHQDLSEFSVDKSEYDPSCTYVMVEDLEFTVIERTVIKEE